MAAALILSNYFEDPEGAVLVKPLRQKRPPFPGAPRQQQQQQQEEEEEEDGGGHEEEEEGGGEEGVEQQWAMAAGSTQLGLGDESVEPEQQQPLADAAPAAAEAPGSS